MQYAGVPTVAAVYDRRSFLAGYHKTGGHRPPLQWENRGKNVNELLTQDTSGQTASLTLESKKSFTFKAGTTIGGPTVLDSLAQTRVGLPSI